MVPRQWVGRLPPYRGREGYWAWCLHRITGLGVLLFLLMHIADTFLVLWPPYYDHVLRWYRTPPFRAMEILLVGMVTFHAMNGIRILVMDFWGAATRYRRELFYLTFAFFALLFIPTLIYMLQAIFTE